MAQLIVAGNASPADVLSGQTFSAGTNYNAQGSMPNNGALGTYTPGTANQSIPAGYTSGGTVAGDTNLVGSNILQGVSIFGVAGSISPGAKYASGSGTSSSTTQSWSGQNGAVVSVCTAVVAGLSFQPSTIMLISSSGGAITVYDAGNSYEGDGKLHTMTTSGSGGIVGVESVSPLVVNSTGFTLPYIVSSDSFIWHAYSAE